MAMASTTVLPPSISVQPEASRHTSCRPIWHPVHADASRDEADDRAHPPRKTSLGLNPDACRWPRSHRTSDVRRTRARPRVSGGCSEARNTSTKRSLPLSTPRVISAVPLRAAGAGLGEGMERRWQERSRWKNDEPDRTRPDEPVCCILVAVRSQSPTPFTSWPTCLLLPILALPW